MRSSSLFALSLGDALQGPGFTNGESQRGSALLEVVGDLNLLLSGRLAWTRGCTPAPEQVDSRYEDDCGQDDVQDPSRTAKVALAELDIPALGIE